MSEFEYYKGIAQRKHPYIDMSGIDEHEGDYSWGCNVRNCPVHNPYDFHPPKPPASALVYVSRLIERYVLPHIDATQARFIKEDMYHGEWENAISNLGATIGKIAGDYE